MGLLGSNKTQQVITAGAVIFALGASVEILKSLASHSSGKTLKVFGFEIEDETSSRSGLKLDALRARKRLSERAPHSMAQLSAPDASNTALNPSHRPTEIKVDNSNRPDDVAAALKAMAQKQAKADQDAKKKKKKKQTADNEVANTNNPSPDSSSRKSNANDGRDRSTPTGGGAGSFAAEDTATEVDANDPSQFTSVEQWVRFLSADPSYERMYQLIERHQFGEVAPELFQNVLAELLTPAQLSAQADSRRLLTGIVMALGSSPSTQSYLKLNQVNASLPANDELKIQSRNHLRTYSRLENLAYLGPVIAQDPSSSASIEALKLIEVSVEQVARSMGVNGNGVGTVGGSQLPGGGTSNPPVTRFSANIASQYAALMDLLTQLSNSSSDSNVRAQATQTLQRLKKYISA